MDNFNFNITKSNNKTNVIQASSFSISINSKKLFDNSTLSLSPNNIYELIGKNGSGKTTLINHISKNKIPVNEKMFLLHLEQILEKTNDSPVDILLQSGGSMYKVKKRLEELEKKMDELEDDDETLEELYEEYNELEEKLSLEEYNIDRETAKVKSILNGLGFDQKMMEKSFNEFSGGWQMRISLAKCLYLDPDVLLMDEPTNHLDLEAVLWLGDYLDKTSKGKIILIVSHNIGFLNKVCTNILNIENYKLVNYTGNYLSFKDIIKQKAIKQDKEWTKVEKQIKKLDKKEKEKLLKDSEEKGIVKPERPYEVKFEFSNYSESKSTNNLISFRDVNFKIGDNELFKDLNFGIDSNSRICLIGKNGIGKSSLFKLISGEYKPTNGSIIIDVKLKIGYFNQHFETFLDNNKSPIEFLENLVPENLLTNNKMQTVRKYLGNLKLEPKFHNTKIGNLSGGQKARVAFVFLIFQQPNFLLLDEPTNHLDIETIEALIDALNEFNGGFMIITHESELLDHIDPNIWLIKNKSINYNSQLFDILK